jgi:hypothetical protein
VPAHLLTIVAALLGLIGGLWLGPQLPPQPHVCTMFGPSTNAVKLGLSCALREDGRGREEQGQAEL